MRLRLALAGLLLLLAACGGGDGRAAFVESRIPPALSPRFWAPEGWAWGLLKIGDAPAQRYGVSSTMGTPRGSILILTGYGETAEAWFETARDLNAVGYTVWVLERAGQGGSERHAGPRDLIHVPTLDGDVAVTSVLARMIVLSAPGTPLTIIGQGDGALVALSAVQKGASVQALVLSNPRLAPLGALPAWPEWVMKVGAGRIPATLGQGWQRSGPDGVTAGLTRDPLRGEIQMAWQTANPDLRMGGPTMGWNAAFARLSRETLAKPAGVRVTTLLIASQDSPDYPAAERACVAFGGCLHAILNSPAGERRFIRSVFPLETDTVRRWWLHNLACALPGGPKTTPWLPDEPCPDA